MQTNPNHEVYLTNVAGSILDSVVDALECKNLTVPERRYVGFDRPSQDCCPELLAWVTNIRPWDLDFPDSRSNGRLLCTNAWAFDIHIRLGQCYVESDENGQPLDNETLQDFANELNKYASAAYFGWANQWRAGNVQELADYNAVTLGPCTPFNSGGCAGWEFVVTVGTI